MLEDALRRNGPTLIRYPRGKCPETMNVIGGELAVEVQNISSSVQIWATGDELPKAMEVAAKTGAGVVYARYLKPFDEELLKRQRQAGAKIVSLENAVVAGGLGEAIGADVKLGWPDEFIPHGSIAELERYYHLDVDSIVAKFNQAKIQ